MRMIFSFVLANFCNRCVHSILEGLGLDIVDFNFNYDNQVCMPCLGLILKYAYCSNLIIVMGKFRFTVDFM
jgi:hypothetical protein